MVWNNVQFQIRQCKGNKKCDMEKKVYFCNFELSIDC